MATIIWEDNLTIPDGVDSLESFRAWTHSEDFPETGRIDFVDGQLEVDMSPENLFNHGSVKSHIVRVLEEYAENNNGYVFTDCTRVASPLAGLSVEPDVVFVSKESLQQHRVELVPAKSGDEDSYIELEGGPDLVVEIVSPGSRKKDTERLPPAYFTARVKEYWVIDAFSDELSFSIFVRGTEQFEQVDTDEEGFALSAVLQKGCKLTRRKDDLDLWRYLLETTS